MAALPVVSGHECISARRQFGYDVARTKGSHARLTCFGRTPLTVPLHKELKAGTLRSILRDADIDVDTFVEALGRI